MNGVDGKRQFLHNFIKNSVDCSSGDITMLITEDRGQYILLITVDQRQYQGFPTRMVYLKHDI